MREVIKKIVKGFFGWFGLEVISKNRVTITPVNTLLHNTEKGHDIYWSNTASKAFWDSKDSHEFFEDIIKELKSKKIDLNDKIIADLGCGSGNLFLHISKYYTPKEYHGYEYSCEALRLAKEIFPGAGYIHHNLLNEIHKEFDFVFCTEVIEHILEPDVVFMNMVKTINPGGGAIITVPEGRKDTSSRHINFWSPESWQVFCQKHLPEGYSCEHSFINELQCAHITRSR